MESAKEKGLPLYTLGPLIHNPQVVQKLEENGIIKIESLDEVEEGTVIIRSHGVPPQVIEDARKKGLKIIDCTCPFVRKAQQKAKDLKKEGFQVIIVGDTDHPEVRGILGNINNQALVVEDPRDLRGADIAARVGVIAQTTLSLSKLQKVTSFLLKYAREIKVYNTICTTTELRQKETYNLAHEVDVMLVVGGRTSANTNRLAQLSREGGADTYHIETAGEIKEEWFAGVERVGITAGASTPHWIIKEVERKMKEMEDKMQLENAEEEVQKTGNSSVDESVEEPVAETAAEPIEEPTDEIAETADEEQMETIEEESADEEEDKEMVIVEEKASEAYNVQQLKRGDVIEGTIVGFSDDGAYIDVGYKTDGFIPLRELTYKPVNSPQEVVEENQKVDVYVIKEEDEDGKPILSKKRADFERAWERIQTAKNEDKIIEAEVTQVVKGGLVVDLGVRGFVPASHVAIEYVEDLGQFVGQKLRLKIIEADRNNNNVVLSRKKVLEEEREKLKEETLSKLEEGQVVKGRVTKIVDFGAFVDLGGIEGLLHISEMSWGRIEHPSEVIEEGEEIEVKVLGVDREAERISLGLKQILPDPWDEFIEKYHVGDVVEGTITKTVSFGAFMEIEKGIEGLIHISQLAYRHVISADEIVKEGDHLKAKIINIDKTERRVGLSLKALEEQKKNKPKKKEREEPAEDDMSGITIGEMVGDILKRMEVDDEE